MAANAIGAPGAGRLGQANLVTVTILVGATLVMALALMAYFTGQAGRASEERGLSDYLAMLSYSIDTAIVARYSYSTEDYVGYCFVVQASWAQSSPARLYVTVLPAYRISPGSVEVDTEVLRVIPRDVIANPGSPELRVYVYLLGDADSDGVVELVGRDGTIVLEGLPSCYEMLSNTTIKYYVLTPLYAAMDSIYLAPRISLEAFASRAGISYDVPLWSIAFGDGGRVRDLFVFVEVPLDGVSPSTLENLNLNLVFLGQLNGEYHASYYAPLPQP